MALDEGMAIAPYGTPNQGRFQTKQGFEEREKNNDGRNFIPTSQHDKTVSAHLERIASKKGTDLLKIALAYVIQKTPYVFPIVGGRKMEHIQGSIDALRVSLSDENMKEVKDGYHFHPGFPHTFLSGTLFDPEAKPWGASAPQDCFLNKPLGTIDFVDKPSRLGASRGEGGCKLIYHWIGAQVAFIKIRSMWKPQCLHAHGRRVTSQE